MSAEATLFGSTSDAPTVPLSNSRTLLRWGEAGLTVFFHASDSRIRAAHSEDGGLTWVPPFDVAIDGTEQFTAVAARGQLHVFYVTPTRGVKLVSLRPGDAPESLPETKVIYMNHEETGDPSFPCAHTGPDGSLHLACSFRRSTGWSVLYRRVEPDAWVPWEVVDSGEGPSPSYVSLAVTAEGLVHAVYRILVGGRFHLFHRLRNSEGWTEATQLTFSSAHNGTPSLAVDGSTLHALWARSEGSRSAIIYRRCRGVEWGGEVRLGDYRDIEANYPALSCRQGSVAAVWEAGQSLVCKVSGDSGATWTEELTVLPDSGARYPKTSELAITPDGYVTFGVAWSRGMQAPWARAGGVDVGVLVVNPRRAIEAMAIGVPVAGSSLAAAKLAIQTPRVKFVDVRGDSSPLEPRTVATPRPEYEGRLRQLEQSLADIGMRLSVIEGREAPSKGDADSQLDALRSQLSSLSNKLDLLTRRLDRPADPRVTPLVALSSSPASKATAQPPGTAPSSSTVRFKNSSARIEPEHKALASLPSPTMREREEGGGSVLSKVFGPKRR